MFWKNSTNEMSTNTGVRPAKGFLLFLLFLALAGCGTIAHGTTQRIACSTTPAGAIVSSGDGTTCSTPCTVTLKRKKDNLLTIERKGYETTTMSLRSILSTSSAANVLLPGGLICWGIDVVAGGGYRLIPDRIDVTLKPVEQQEPEDIAFNEPEL